MDIEGNKPKQQIKRLSLTPISEGLMQGIKKNGIKYSVRNDRSRYFWPEEWEKYFNEIPDKNKPINDALINTGGRIDEVLHIEPKDFDWERNNLTLRVTKKKAAKKERIGKPRTFAISSQFARRMRKYINDNKIADNEKLFKVTQQSVYQLMRRTLKRIGIKDWYAFSLHNIRKTHGNYLKALGVDSGEICYRLGHDLNTFIKHYGSANVFDRKDKLGMVKILGDLYGIK